MSFRNAIPPQVGTRRAGGAFIFVFEQDRTGKDLNAINPPLCHANERESHYETFCRTVSRLLQVETDGIVSNVARVAQTAAARAGRPDPTTKSDPSLKRPVSSPSSHSPLVSPDVIHSPEGGDGIIDHGSLVPTSATTTTSGEYTITSDCDGEGEFEGGWILPARGEQSELIEALEVLSFSDESSPPYKPEDLTVARDEFMSGMMEDFLHGSIVIDDSDLFRPPSASPSVHASRRGEHARRSTISSTASSVISTINSVLSTPSTANCSGLSPAIPSQWRHRKIANKLGKVMDRVSDRLSAASSRPHHLRSPHWSSAGSSVASGGKSHSEMFREALASKRDSLLDQYSEL